MFKFENLFFVYCANDAEKILQLFSSIVKDRQTLIAKGGAGVEKIVVYMEIIVKYYINNSIYSTQGIGNLIKFIDLEILLNFSQKPEEKSNRDILGQQILLFYSSLGVGLPVSEYTSEEIKKIIDGEFSFYDDNVLAYTLGRLYNNKLDANKYLPYLINFFNTENGVEFKSEMDWKVAFIYALLLHVLWNKFLILSTTEKEILLQNYFYNSVVAGVQPINYLDNYIDYNVGNRQGNIDYIFSNLFLNQELVPLKDDFRDFIIFNKFAEKILIFANKDYLKTEEKLNEYYSGSKYKEFFKKWMHEAMRVYFLQ